MYRFNKTYRILALSMAMLMFTTSISFAIDMHYCGGELKTFSLFGKAKICHEVKDVAAPMKNCPHHKKMMQEKKEASIEKKNCCENRTLHFQSDQDFEIQIADFSIDRAAQQLVYITGGDFSSSVDIEQDIPAATHYKPPLILKDIPILIQSFLL